MSRPRTVRSMTRILYCHCTYAQVVPKATKEAVLEKLCASGVNFEACADLCEMSARKDPALKRLAEGHSIKIAACYPLVRRCHRTESRFSTCASMTPILFAPR